MTSENAARSRRRIRPVPTLATFVAIVGTGVYVLDSDLVNFFLPARQLVLACMIAAAVLLGVHAARQYRSGGSISRLSSAVLVLSVVMAITVYAREFSAYREVDLSFQSEGARMEGTLYLPKGTSPSVGVVIAQGSIRAPRRLYHLWADRLVRSGIAVFSFDKRGTGSSGGTYESDNNASEQNLRLLAADVAAAVIAMQGNPDLDGGSIGILGLSMGGWLAPLAAQQTTSAKFMVLVSGPTVSVGEENYYSDLAGEIHGDGSGLTATAIDSLVDAWEPSGFDPRSLLQELTIPAHWLFGGSDSSIPVSKSVAVLDSLIEGGKPYSYKVYPDAEHLGFEMKWPYDLASGFTDEIAGWTKSQTMP